METFRRNPVGIQSHPVEPSRQPEASLAWWFARTTAKRRQPGRRPCIEPRNCHQSWEPPPSKSAWAASVSRHGQRHRSRRGRRPGRTSSRVPKEPGSPVLLHRRSRLRGVPNPNFPASGCASGTGGSEAPDAADGIVGRGTKPVETEEQASERSHSTGEAGELISKEPRGGKGNVESSNRWRATWRRHRTPISCQRDNNGSPSWRVSRRGWGSRP